MVLKPWSSSQDQKTVVVLIFVLVSNLRFSGFVSDLIKLVL